VKTAKIAKIAVIHGTPGQVAKIESQQQNQKRTLPLINAENADLVLLL